MQGGALQGPRLLPTGRKRRAGPLCAVPAVCLQAWRVRGCLTPAVPARQRKAGTAGNARQRRRGWVWGGPHALGAAVRGSSCIARAGSRLYAGCTPTARCGMVGRRDGLAHRVQQRPAGPLAWGGRAAGCQRGPGSHHHPRGAATLGGVAGGVSGARPGPTLPPRDPDALLCRLRCSFHGGRGCGGAGRVWPGCNTKQCSARAGRGMTSMPSGAAQAGRGLTAIFSDAAQAGHGQLQTQICSGAAPGLAASRKTGAGSGPDATPKQSLAGLQAARPVQGMAQLQPQNRAWPGCKLQDRCRVWPGCKADTAPPRARPPMPPALRRGRTTLT